MVFDDINRPESVIDILLAQALGAKNDNEYIWPSEILTNYLSDSNENVRDGIARELISRGVDRKIFDTICLLHTSKSSDEREVCAFLLGNMNSIDKSFSNELLIELSLKTLLILINDDCPKVRSTSAISLGHLYKNECATEMPLSAQIALLKLAEDIEAEVRVCAAASFVYAPLNAETLKTLDKFRNDPDEEVRSWGELSRELLVINPKNQITGGLTDQQAEEFSEAIEDKNLSYNEMLEVALKIKHK